ncbi:MAG: FtsX-like permease family protein [Cocleimonas sp.]|nr:FtsX-like permease family protein [Cocleimonas sp.]
MNFFLKQWQQYWRITEVRLLFLALLVSVTAITSVGFFTDRADKAMSQQATQLMGGDLIVSSSRPIDQHYLSHAKSLGLHTAEMISFPSMVSSGEKMQLAQIKAVSAQYPLTGELDISDSLLDESSRHHQRLTHNQAWSEARLFIALGIQPNATVQLGKIELQLTKRIIKMPDQGLSAFQIAPVLLMPLEQLPETGLLTPASRARFNQLFAGETDQINTFVAWLKPQLKRSERIRTLEDGLPAIEQALTRGKRFLSLAALLSVILAGAAIALTSYSLNQRETRTVAVLKTLGASRKLILRRYLSQLFFTATLAALVGAVIGYIIQLGIVYLLQDIMDQVLPSTGLFPIVTGFLTAYIMVLGFSAPQLIQLVNIAPVHILQGQKTTSSSNPYRYAVIAILGGTLLLMWIQTKDIKLSLFLLIATVLATLLFWFISKGLLNILRLVNQKFRRTNSVSLPKPNPRISLLIVVFGIGLFSLLLLTALRTDLIARWQATIPDKAPNHFLINIQENEVKSLQAIFKNKQMTAPLYPMIRGRLVAINNKAVSAADYTEGQAKRLMTREFNMSAITVLQTSNKIVGGHWFTLGENKGLSVEEGIAKTLGLQLGDTLAFDVAGQRLSDKITSLRSVRWDSMQPNFFVLATPSALENYPRTYITSIHVPKQESHFIPELIHQYPSITDININAIMTQVKELINKAAFAVQAIFSFTLIAGIIVLFAALQSQKAERSKEIAILKSIGASRAYLSKHLIIEFTLIGAVAGLIAGILAVIAANIAAYILFDLTPSINYLLILSGVLTGAVLVGVAGYLNMRPLLNTAPVTLFREG